MKTKTEYLVIIGNQYIKSHVSQTGGYGMSTSKHIEDAEILSYDDAQTLRYAFGGNVVVKKTSYKKIG